MTEPKSRPEVLHGKTHKIPSACGNMYVTINLDELGNPFEIFIQQGKSGGCQRATMEAICRLASVSLRSGVDIGVVIRQLEHIRCPNPVPFGPHKMTSCVDGIARLLKQEFLNGSRKYRVDEEPEKEYPNPKIDNHNSVLPTSPKPPRAEEVYSGQPCPDCGNPLVMEGGCQYCRACGYDKCG